MNLNKLQEIPNQSANTNFKNQNNSLNPKSAQTSFSNLLFKNKTAPID